MAVQNIETLDTWITKYNADTVEWCPIHPFQHLFVCGTYQLSEESQNLDKQADLPDTEEQILLNKNHKKIGCLYLFSIGLSGSLLCLQTIDMPAILDSKWCHVKINGKILLGIANSRGEVLLYRLEVEEKYEPGFEDGSSHTYKLTPFAQISICSEREEDILALSLDWSTGQCGAYVETAPSITVSDSKGGVTLLKLTDTSLQVVCCWKAHQFEAWITAFNYWNPSVIYSGGDDCKFCVFDTRTVIHSPVLTNRAHEMGVTSLHCNAVKENRLISGSYDEKLRFWDTRNMRRPLSITPLIGGIWRVKWDPQRWEDILAACMYGGFCTLNCSADMTIPEIISVYKEHESLAYGSDWCHLSDIDVKGYLNNHEDTAKDSFMSFIATCSFYDNKLCVSLLKRNPLAEEERK